MCARKRIQSLEFLQQLCRAGFEFALPDDEDTPTVGLQSSLGLVVTFHVAIEFGIPHLAVGRRTSALRTIVTVPEASVNEHSDLESPQNYVRPTGE